MDSLRIFDVKKQIHGTQTKNLQNFYFLAKGKVMENQTQIQCLVMAPNASNGNIANVQYN